MNEASLATLGSQFLFHGNIYAKRGSLSRRIAGSHSCTVAILFNISSAVLLLFCRFCMFCNAVQQHFFKNNLPKKATVFPAEYITEGTRVRRNKSSIRNLLPGTKNVFFKFISRPAIFFLLGLLIFCNAETFSQKGSSNKVVINFKNTVGDKLLQIYGIYTNPFGEIFSVRTFKYYI